MGDLADWAELGPTIVALVAIIAAALTTWFTLRHTRRLEANKRVWERRADVYVDLQTWLTEVIAAGGTGVPLPIPLKARTTLFASVKVRADLFLLETSIRALELDAQKKRADAHDSMDTKYQFDLDADNFTKRLILELQGKEALRYVGKYLSRTMVKQGERVREARENRVEQESEFPSAGTARLQTIKATPDQRD